MLINLSSTGENSPSKFTNFFLDNITLKPNSKVCLIRASLTRNATHLSFVIPAGTTISYRTSPYDVITKIINAVDVRYTADTLTDRLNELLNGNISFGYEIEVYTEKVGEHDFEINITSFLNNTRWDSVNLNEHLFGNSVDFFNGHKQCKMLGGADLTLPTIDQGNELRGVRFENVLRQGFGGGWGSNVPIPTGQINKNAYNMTTNITGFGSSFFTYVNPPVNDNFYVVIDHATFNDVDDRYTTGGAAGMIGWGNPHPVKFTYNAIGQGDARAGRLSLDMQDHTNTTLDAIITTTINPGDVIQYKVETGQTAGNYDTENLFSPLIKKRGHYGLILWMPNRIVAGSGVYFFNNHFARYESYNAYWNSYNTNALLSQHLNPYGIMGSRAGRGQKSTEERQIDASFRSIINPVTTVGIEVVLSPGQLWDKMPFYRAYSNTAGVTDNANYGQFHLLDVNGIPSGNMPTFYSCVFGLHDKSSHTAQIKRGFLGGVTVKETLVIYPTIGAPPLAPDMIITEKDGVTTHNVVLNNASAVRIPWAYATPYIFQFKMFGSANPNGMILVTDLNTNEVYFSTVTFTAGGLDELKQICACEETAVDNQQFLHGYVYDWRIYQHNLNSDTSLTSWDALVLDQRNYYTGAGAWSDATGGPYGKTIMEDLYTLGEFKYCNWGADNNQITQTPFISSEGTPDVYDNGWYNFTDIFFYPCIRMPVADRVTNLNPYHIYDEAGQGVVASNDLDSYLNFENYNRVTEVHIEAQNENTQDLSTNPIALTESEQSEVDIDDKIFNVEIKNLPHRTYNGSINTFDKTIYTIGSLVNAKTIENSRVIEVYPPQKTYLELNNPGEIILNQLEVQISDEFGIQETDLQQETHLTLEIINE